MVVVACATRMVMSIARGAPIVVQKDSSCT